MKYICFSVFLLGAVVLFGQSTASSPTDLLHQTSKPLRWSINTMPFSTIRSGIFNSYSRFRMGLQAQQKKIHYLLDLEYGDNWFINRDKSHYIHYGIRPEVQYHFEYHERGSVYCALEVAFNYAEKSVGAGTYRSTDGMRYRFDASVQKRIKTTAIIKIGGVQKIGERFYADFYFGFGPGIRNVNYLDQLNRRISQTEPTEEWFSSSDLIREGSIDIFALAAGIRIGYKL